MQVTVAEANGLRRRDALRLDEELLDERRRVPEALSLEPVRPVASPLDTEWHVGAPDWVERELGVELEPMECPEELGKGGGETCTCCAVEIGVRKLLTREIRGSVERPLELF